MFILFGLILSGCQYEDNSFIKPVPVALDATDIGTLGFKAKWKPILGAKNYTLEVATDDYFEATMVENYPKEVTDTAYQATGLEAGQTYYYRVRAAKITGDTEYSNVIKVITKGLSPPQALDAANVTPLSFTAQWQSVSGVNKYLLYIANDIDFTNLVEGYDGLEVKKDTIYQVNDLVVNQKYFYRVQAKRGNAVSGFSNTIFAPTSELATPVVRDASEINYTGFTVNWNEVPSATSYLVFVSKDPLMTDTLPGYGPKEVKGLSLTVEGLSASTVYYYRLQAKNDATLSGKSDIASCKTKVLDIPLIQPASNIQINSFQANWNAVADAEGYILDVATDAGFTNFLPGYEAKETINTFEVITGLDADKAYYYRVRAKKGIAVSYNSEVETTTTSTLDPPVVSAASEVQMESFRANWSAVPNADSYLLDVASDPSFQNVIPGFNALEVFGTFEAVSGLLPSTTYYYRVRAKGYNATSAPSNIMNLTTMQLQAPDALSATNQKVFEFTANWGEVTGADGYLLDVATDAAFTQILTNYNGKEVIGSSSVVTGLYPYTTYYYRLRSKKLSAQSGYSNATAVSSCITNGCRLSSREGSGWGREVYIYNPSSGLLTTIQRFDSFGAKMREISINYSSGSKILYANIFEQEGGYLTPKEYWRYAYGSNSKVSTIDKFDDNNVLKEHLKFVYGGDQLLELQTYADISETTLINKEKYTYNANGQVTSVADKDGVEIKRFTYGDGFNGESLMSRDISLLLANDNGNSNYPFVALHNITSYEYYNGTTWTRYDYTFTFNAKGIPNSRSGGTYNVNYMYENCGF